MDNAVAMAGFGALAQPTRLAVFRLLIGAGPDGLAAGAIAAALGVPHNTLSSHLGVLARAGLVRAQRASRSMIYSVDLDGTQALLAFLLADCCGGRPELCAPLVALTGRAGQKPKAARRPPRQAR